MLFLLRALYFTGTGQIGLMVSGWWEWGTAVSLPKSPFIKHTHTKTKPTTGHFFVDSETVLIEKLRFKYNLLQ
jgi:hypothetical protein